MTARNVAGDLRLPGWRARALISRCRYAVFILAALCVLLSGHRVAADELDAEYQIKAAFLYKFGGYVKWPVEPGKHFTIAVMGADSLAAHLSDMARDRSIAGRPIEVRVVGLRDELSDVQVLFVGRKVNDEADVILASVRDEPVLTVTELPDPVPPGGVINFVVVNNRVRFDIALSSAERRKLKISARLLEVARNVVEKPS